MIVSTSGIVLSKLKYKDSDLIVKCYTASNGVVSFLVRCSFSSKKSKLRPAYFQLLSIIDFEMDFKINRNLQYIKSLNSRHIYISLHSEIVKSTVALFISEILVGVLKQEEADENLYSYIESSLIWFDTITKNSFFHQQFLMGLTKYLGVYPSSLNSDFSFFNLETGEYQNKKSNDYCISGEKLNQFNLILGTKFDESNKILMDNVQKKETLNMILLYYKFHLQGFKNPRSLDILNQVFDQ